MISYLVIISYDETVTDIFLWKFIMWRIFMDDIPMHVSYIFDFLVF